MRLPKEAGGEAPGPKGGRLCLWRFNRLWSGGHGVGAPPPRQPFSTYAFPLSLHNLFRA